jgi:hypothetical protein
MKQSILVFLLICAATLFGQDKSVITVKDSTVSHGVAIVNIHESGKPFELQCTESVPRCTAPQPGSYWMIRLPKNHGFYDCANVDLYSQSETSENPDKILGEYCINDK